MKELIIGALVGEAMLFAFIFFSYRTELLYDFDAWFKKHSKSLYIAMIVAGIFGMIVAVSDGSGSPCREFGRYASSC